MKLEWNTMNFPKDPTQDYFWEKGVIVNFDTAEAKSSELRMTSLYSELMDKYTDEFIVVDVKELTDRPKHLTKYSITLLRYADGNAFGKQMQINYPALVSNSARWLRIVDQYTIKIEKDFDEEIIYENEAVQK